jgi:ubiquinone/menaquinone biosynthesis C-methylase UbiE
VEESEVNRNKGYDVSAMKSDYLTDREYRTYWLRLEGLRRDISESLGLSAGMKILDVGTGSGLFAVEMARLLKKGEIVGIDITFEDVNMARKLAEDSGVVGIVSILKMDAVKLSFSDNYFDLATSFLGMRDIHMTRGKRGVKKAVEEMIRVVKPNGRIVLCITPPEDMETEDQRSAVKLEGEIFGAESMSKKFYIDIFRENNVVLRETRAYLTNKKLTASQAKIELREGTEIARKIYGKKISPFKEVWDKHGKDIETFGYGMYSKIIMLIAEKLGVKRDSCCLKISPGFLIFLSMFLTYLPKPRFGLLLRFLKDFNMLNFSSFFYVGFKFLQNLF